MDILLKGQPFKITDETIIKTRKWYADNAQACIDEAVSGKVRVNNLEEYIAWCQQSAADSIAGKSDHTLSFVQMAVYLQTGESVAILPK